MASLRRLAYALYASARGIRAGQVLARLESVEAPMDPDECRNGALARLLEHCRDRVPYYRAYLGGRAITPDSSREILRSLPLLTKEIIREQGAALVANDLDSRRWFHNSSGGSTGEPVRLVQDQEYADLSRASTLWVYRRMGYEFGDRLCRLWGDEREILKEEPASVGRLRDWLYNTTTLNSFRMTPARMRQYLRELNARPAQLIVAYAQSAYELARFAIEQDFEVEPQHAMTSSAGTLYDPMRAAIERVFGCKVHNYYGSREVGLIATELPGEAGMFVPPWCQVLEVIGDDGAPIEDGGHGELVVTCLMNRAMPLLRYRIGDRGALLPSRDREPQRLLAVRGRTVDVFRARDGTRVDGEYFTHLLYGRDWVLKFQFRQQSYDDVHLLIVKAPGQPVPSNAIELLERDVRAVLGPGARLHVSFVDDIAPSVSGKFRYTICDMPVSQ